LYMLSYMCMIFYCTFGPAVKFEGFICKDTYVHEVGIKEF
jgi:hypothetical protein